MAKNYFSACEEFENQIATIMLIKNGAQTSGIDMVQSYNKIKNFESLNKEIKPLYLLSDQKVKDKYDKLILNNEVEMESTGSALLKMVDYSEMPGGKYYHIFNNFSISRMDEATEEIVSVHQHFGGSFSVFSFGSAVRVYNISGVFIDGKNQPQYQTFSTFYESHFKASKSAASNVACLFSVNGKVLDGIMINLKVSTDASNEKIKGFNFTYLIKKVDWIRYNSVYGKDVLNGMTNEREFLFGLGI